MKTALMFIDDGAIKVVLGQTLKCVKLQEVSLDYNVRFFDRVFAEASVFIVENAEQMTPESFKEYLATLTNETQEPEREQEEKPVVKTKKPTGSPKESSRPSQSSLYRSTSQTYIIVDDLPVGDNLRGTEAKRYLSIPPNKAINLSVLDQEAVKNSSILKGLINDGTLVPCSSQEAVELDRDAEFAVQQERESAYTDQFAPLIPEGISAADFADQSSRKGRLRMEDVHDAQTIDVDSSNEPEFDPNKPLTMDQMLKMTGAVGDDSPPPDYSAPRQRRQLAAREPVPKTGIKPKLGIIRR